MFSLIRLAKVEGHGEKAAHIHHSQGGKLLQLLSQGTARRSQWWRGLEQGGGVGGRRGEPTEKKCEKEQHGRGGCGGGTEEDVRGEKG